MKISILMTCYNRGNLLNISMPSVLAQKPDEIVIVDDGSVDNTWEIVSSWQKRSGPTEIKYFYRNHLGYNNGAIPKNIALKQSTGDLIIISDPEVIHFPKVIQKMREHHEKDDRVYTVASTMYFVTEYPQRHLMADPSVILPGKLEAYLSKADKYHVGYIGCDNIYYMERNEATFIGGFKRKHLYDIGGWDERFDKYWGLDDTDLITRLCFSGVHRIVDHSIKGVHQYHTRPPVETVQGVDEVNLKILQSWDEKNFVANIGKAWGILLVAQGEVLL